jgi:hypothetical protein
MAVRQLKSLRTPALQNTSLGRTKKIKGFWTENGPSAFDAKGVNLFDENIPVNVITEKHRNRGLVGRAMAQAVSGRLLTAEARVLAQVSGICGGLTGTGTGFPPSPSVFPSQYYSTAVHIHTYMRDWQKERWRPSSMQTQSHPRATKRIRKLVQK